MFYAINKKYEKGVRQLNADFREGIGMDKKLGLYKICCTSDDEEYPECLVEESRWIGDKKFCVWVSWFFIEDFIKELLRIFGYAIFDDGGFNVNIQADSVCIDLCEAVGHCIDLEEVFPKEKCKQILERK